MEENKKSVNTGELLAKYIEALNYGDVIHYQDIEEVTKERRKTQRYYAAIYKAKKILMENGKAIKPIGGGDYQVLYPGDYASAYSREIRIAKNHVKRGGKILVGAPVSEMSIDERKTFNDVSDFHVRLQAQMAGSYVEVKRLTGKRKHPLSVNA